MSEISNNDFFEKIIEIFKQAKNNLKVAVNMTMTESGTKTQRVQGK